MSDGEKVTGFDGLLHPPLVEIVSTPERTCWQMVVARRKSVLVPEERNSDEKKSKDGRNTVRGAKVPTVIRYSLAETDTPVPVDDTV
jgi:hypothetical protein